MDLSPSHANRTPIKQISAKHLQNGSSSRLSSSGHGQIGKRLKQNAEVIDMLYSSRLERSKSRRKEIAGERSPSNQEIRRNLLGQISTKLDSVIPVNEIPSPPLSPHGSHTNLMQGKIRNLETMLRSVRKSNEEEYEEIGKMKERVRVSTKYELYSPSDSRIFRNKMEGTGYRYPKYLKPNDSLHAADCLQSHRAISHRPGCHCRCHN